MGSEVKVGVLQGGGPPPGYQWHVWVPDLAYDEARKILTESQYDHMAMQVKELAREVDPTHASTADVDAVEEFYELRDSGGPLGGLNVRVFFHLDRDERCIFILGVIKKQNNGPTPLPDKVRMRRRKRKYDNGEFEKPTAWL